MKVYALHRKRFLQVIAAGLATLPAAAHAEGGFYGPPAVGLLVGAAYGPDGVRFSYGLNFSWAPSHVFVRVEGRGKSYLKLAGGASVSTGPSYEFLPQEGRFASDDNAIGFGGEVGVAAHLGGPGALKSALGAHVRAGFGNYLGGLLATGTYPLAGDLHNWEAAANVAATPLLLLAPLAGGAVAHGRVLRMQDAAGLPVATADCSAINPDVAAIAQAWLADARAEHASILAFVRLAAELVAVGAPAALAEACLVAAAQEQDHAAACYAQVQRVTGTAPVVGVIGAAPRFTMPSPEAIGTLAAEAWSDGCVGEAAAARQLQLAARATADPALRAALHQMAKDEASHARLAWAILQWAWGVAPQAVQVALQDLAPATWAEMPSCGVADGRIAADARRRSYAATHRQASRRLERLMAC